MADIFVCPPGTLKDRDKRALRAAGVIPIETERGDLCRFLRACESVSADDMLWAAVDALNKVGGKDSIGGFQRREFAANVLKVIVAGRQPKEMKP